LDKEEGRNSNREKYKYGIVLEELDIGKLKRRRKITKSNLARIKYS
jgi:hypothetical protein